MELRGESNDNGLDLRNIDRKKEEWKKLVQSFLSEEPSRKFLKTIKGYDFIEGPMVAKGGYDFSGFPKSGFPKSKNHSYQLCVRTENCSSLFHTSLYPVVYFA